MPELPEVEIVKQGLERLLGEKPRFRKLEALRPDLRFPIPTYASDILANQDLLGIHRRAKYLFFETKQGHLISHLGMTGTWRLYDRRQGLRPHDHVLLHFAKKTLVYNDPRRFGFLQWLPATQSLRDYAAAHKLGPEPLDTSSFHRDYLWQKSRAKKQSIKSFLMDQATVVGVGNIYAAEALFLAGIQPQRPAHNLSKDRAHRLVTAVQEVLAAAILAGGSSISDYKQASGEKGYFQMQFKVYGREGLGCYQCATPIRNKVIAGRSSFYCPRCQR